MPTTPYIEARDNSRFAAGFVAKALANTPPAQRHEVLSQMMAQCAAGIAVICGTEGASEEAYRLGDKIATGPALAGAV